MADGQTSEGCNPESKRVHVPFGTWVLSFVRFAPNDRFGPESASPPVWFRGEFYMPPQAAIKWRRQAPTSPAGTVSQPIGKPFNGQAKGLLWLTWRSYAGPPQYYITPEGGALNPPVRRSRSQAEPLAPRAKGPAAPSTLTPVRACQPSGIPASTAQVPIPTAERPYCFT